jgi:hypothetical protein
VLNLVFDTKEKTPTKGDKNRVQRRMFEPKTDVIIIIIIIIIIIGWRRLHNEELRNLYYSPTN